MEDARDRRAEPASTGYRTPPSPIPEILATPPTPGLSLSPDRRLLALLGRESLPSIAELAEPELRLAGLRINPRTHGPSRQSYYHSITVLEIDTGERRTLSLPTEARLSSVIWAPDSSRLAFVRTTGEGMELWVAESAGGEPRRVLGGLAAPFGDAPYHWMPDSRSLVATTIPEGIGVPPAPPAVPRGPVVQENLGGAAPARTHQDLLASPHDEDLFDHYFTSRLLRIHLDTGEVVPLGTSGVISEVVPSPSGEYLRVERQHRPYSYLVPYYRFPTTVLVLRAADGEVVRVVAELPLAENVPVAFDAVPTGPRSIQWRADAPATLVWAEALDGGDPRNPTPLRDRVYLWDAPFGGEPRVLAELEHRFAGIYWGRGDLALLQSRWWETRRHRVFAVAPDAPGTEPRLLVDRSYEHRYDDPGTPVVTRNEAGRLVLLFAPDGEHVFLEGDGASPSGDYPFLDRWNLRTGETERVWQAEDPWYEYVAVVLSPDGSRVITRRETTEVPPNFYLRDLREGTLRPITEFPDPAPQLAGIRREILLYAREDGVRLSATLYTPPGYDPARDGPLPMLVWAYPREYRDAAAAGQVNDSAHRFSRPAGASHLFLLTQGYAILDGPAMPIVGEGEEEPNDRYLEQLVSNARAAVDAVVERGIADPERIAVGGHSYGAFMAVNLLAHSGLFRAGVARSGAYNRTLTPFGFQSEQRSYWEAMETYNRMSPFTHADRVRDPLLLIHGAADNNPGTLTLQSERLYHALKGLGSPVRLVLLPHESHGYQARESVLHVLAEMVEWMGRYVRDAEPREASGADPDGGARVAAGTRVAADGSGP